MFSCLRESVINYSMIMIIYWQTCWHYIPTTMNAKHSVYCTRHLFICCLSVIVINKMRINWGTSLISFAVCFLQDDIQSLEEWENVPSSVKTCTLTFRDWLAADVQRRLNRTSSPVAIEKSRITQNGSIHC